MLLRFTATLACCMLLTVSPSIAIQTGQRPGLKLECSLQGGGNVTVANRTQIDIPAGTNIELRSGSNQRVTISARRGLPVKGRLNIKDTGLSGRNCTAHTLALQSP